MSDEIKDLQDSLGPKRVKTTDVEVEMHDPTKLQKLVERTKPKRAVLLSSFAFTKVSPKNANCICEKDNEHGDRLRDCH